MVASRRHSNDAPTRKGLALLRQLLVLLVAVAQLAAVSIAPAPDRAGGGEGKAVRECSRHAHGALVAQRRRKAGRRVELCHDLAVAKEACGVHLRAARREPPLAVNEEAVRLACRRPHRRVGLAQQRSEAQPPHGAALALWQRWQLEAALLRPQADAVHRKRGVQDARDARGASDVDGVAAGEDAQEEVRGEIEEAGGRRRVLRGGGGGGGGEAARAAARQGRHREEKK